VTHDAAELCFPEAQAVGWLCYRTAVPMLQWHWVRSSFANTNVLAKGLSWTQKFWSKQEFSLGKSLRPCIRWRQGWSWCLKIP